MCFFLCCSSDPPPKSTAKGMYGNVGNAFIGKQTYPNAFALGLKDAPCVEPKCCILGTLGAPCGFTACWARKAVLEKYGGGVQDFICLQGYAPGCCCIQPNSCFPGSPVGLYLEGCCCPMISLSIARIHLMDAKRLHPDPMDYQIIACSNVLQVVSCLFSVVAALSGKRQLEDAAAIVDLVADLFTMSVAGCMAAQVSHEIHRADQAAVVATAVAVPVQSTMERA